MDPIQIVNEDHIVDEQRITKVTCECLWVARPVHCLNDLVPFTSIKLWMTQVHAVEKSWVTIDMHIGKAYEWLR